MSELPSDLTIKDLIQAIEVVKQFKDALSGIESLNADAPESVAQSGELISFVSRGDMLKVSRDEVRGVRWDDDKELEVFTVDNSWYLSCIEGNRLLAEMGIDMPCPY